MERHRRLHLRPDHTRQDPYRGGLLEPSWLNAAWAACRVHPEGQFLRSGDDGLLQRFGLLIWPDQSGEWKEIDRYPDGEAKRVAWEAFKRLDELSPEAVGTERDEFESVPVLRLDPEAQALFSEWRADLEKRLRGGDMAPALESHLAKYRKLVPALALINHLVDGGAGPIPETAVLRALALSDYLETHARRAYGSGINAESAAANAILKHIRKGDLQDGFM